MVMLLGIDHAFAPLTRRQARLEDPPKNFSPLLNQASTLIQTPPTRLPLGEPFARADGQVERGSSVAQVSQAIPRTAVRSHSLAT